MNELGQKLARATGRNDFEYEFYVVLDDDLNAFALPGGKCLSMLEPSLTPNQRQN